MLALRLLAVIRRLRPRETVHDLHRRYAFWFAVIETAVLDAGLDLRREFWWLLAVTQDMAAGVAPRRLMALWLELCAEAGPNGRFDESYLDVGLAGLRDLPLGAEHAANEEVVCHGIARWAVRQQPGRRGFLARWREIESAFPRNPTFWPPLVDEVIAATEVWLEDERSGERSFPAAAWWRDEVELPRARPGQRTVAADRRRSIEPPPREWREGILRDIGLPVAALHGSNA
jgi:hypothetical protein